MKRIIDDIINSISPVKRFHGNVTCLLDLSDEIILLICRYLSQYDILYSSFYTPEMPNMRLHCLISDYYTKINLGSITYDQFNYFLNLFNRTDYPLRPESLRLNNENISYLIEHYFFLMSNEIIQSIFINLINLNLIDCCSSYLRIIDRSYKDLSNLQYLHITIRKSNQSLSEFSLQFIFRKKKK
jgi:hypothetical protein